MLLGEGRTQLNWAAKLRELCDQVPFHRRTSAVPFPDGCGAVGFHEAHTVMMTSVRNHNVAAARIERLTNRERRRDSASTSSALLPSGLGWYRHRPVASQMATSAKTT